MPPTADFEPIRFSTSDLPERERVDRWREGFGRRVIGVEIEPRASDAPFYAEATLHALPACRIASCAGSAGRLNRAPTLAAQRGREARLQQGHATLLMHQRFYGE
jgi:hypothetical protein